MSLAPSPRAPCWSALGLALVQDETVCSVHGNSKGRGKGGSLAEVLTIAPMAHCHAGRSQAANKRCGSQSKS